MAIRRPRDQVGRLRRLRAGIRQVARLAIGVTGNGGSRRRARAYRTPPTAKATTRTAARASDRSLTLIWLNRVVAIRTSDIINRIDTMKVASTFSQGRLTHGPSTS